MLVWLCFHLLSGFLVNGHFPKCHVSQVNRLMIGMVMNAHRSPDISFMAMENPGKPKLGDRQIQAVRPVIALSGVPYLQMISVGSCYDKAWKMLSASTVFSLEYAPGIYLIENLLPFLKQLLKYKI